MIFSVKGSLEQAVTPAKTCTRQLINSMKASVPGLSPE